MAVKKTDAGANPAEIDTTAAPTTEASAPTVEVKRKVVKADDVAFCMYLGPTIHGVIQSGTVYSGNRAATEATLATAIARYPFIAKLIVTDKTLAEDCVKVKTAGNALHVYYRKLASGKSV